MDIAGYARSLVRQHDKDGDNMLKGDELRELRGRAAGADLDKDGVITIDELVMHLSGGSATATSSTGPSGGSESSGRGESAERGERFSRFGFRRGERDRQSREDGSSEAKAGTMKRVYTALGADEKDARRSYRFMPASERLQEKLPSWFKSRDKNGDAQVSMSEYSRTWTARTVDEFRRYDSDGDGVITAKEAARGE
jgi:hypothetical protein